MNVQSIRLENWKKFTYPVEIELKNGLNILYGPNESGKSTLIDSIITTFYSKHTSGSGKIKSLKPWGSSLQPRSTITFQKNGQKYRITKGFQERKSLLEKMEGEAWRKIAEGDKADQELIQLVGGQLPPRGDTKPELWGLGQTLWMVQGKPIISDDLNDETLSCLQTMLGATIESDKEKKVLGEIRSRFLDIFTEKKRTLKKGSELSKVQEEIKTLKDELSQSERNKTRTDELIREIDDTEFLLKKNQSNLESAKKEKDKLEEEVEAARKHQKNREEIEREIKELDSKSTALKEKIDQINQNKDEIRTIQSSINDINNKIGPLQEQFEFIDTQIQDKTLALQDTNDDIQKSIEEKNIAGIAHSTLKDEITLESLKDRFQEISQLYDDLYLHQEKYNTIIAPSSKELEKLENLHQEIHDSQTRLQTIGLNVDATAQPRMEGEISLDNHKNPFSLKNNESISWTASQSIKIKIDQVGEFVVRSGSQDVKEMQEKLQNMQAEYNELAAPYGTDELNKLKELQNNKDSLKKEVERIEILLGKKSNKSKEDLQQEIMTSQNKIKSNWDKIPDDSPYKNCEKKDKTPVIEELSGKLNQLQDEIDSLSKHRNQLNYEIEDDRKRAQELSTTINDNNQDAYGKSQRIDEIKKVLSRLEDDGLTKEEREDKLDQLSFDLDQKTRAWKVYQGEIEEKEQQPLSAFEGLKKKLERLEEDNRSQEIKKARADSELQMLISQSTDTTILEENLEQFENKEKNLQTEAEALKLLFDLTSFYRENIIGELSKPIRKRVTEDLEKLLGTKYSLIFNKEMKPDTILAHGEEAPIDLLSFGTQEQVWCIFRLALGTILSRDERQLVVLDDPLVNTDPVRMHHALQILQENAENMQIIVVTCDVDKYNSLTDANFISMDDTLRR
ncbi:MAG: AAA family ATPase [Methanomicrobiales archaeon]